jgi:hypothetical protein
MENREIMYICDAVKWFDKANGNTYHSCRITRCKDGAVCVAPFQYGYGDHYRQSAVESMVKAGWIDAKYKDCPHMFERENSYPIKFIEYHGLKRVCIENGKL